MLPALERIIDANLNRAREGLRVAEELARLVLEDGPLQSSFRAARHGLTHAEKALLPDRNRLRHRAVATDPGASTGRKRISRRAGWTDLARANLRRSEEALRVLEEVAPLCHPASVRVFHRLRFRVYALEQALVARLVRNEAGHGRRK
jgi:thiamine-phosphate pyrophosphorylase